MFTSFFVSWQNERYINAKSLIELNHVCTSYLDKLRNMQLAVVTSIEEVKEMDF